MKHALSFHEFRGLALLLCLTALPALSETMVLDGDDVTDWVRVFSTSSWKHKDSCLYPNALLKFDLAGVGPIVELIDARLHLFIERPEPGNSIGLWHVTDDTWHYGLTEPDTLWNWPLAEAIGAVSPNDTMSFSMDVTDVLREELVAGDEEFSVKITTAGIPYPDIRIASPQAPIQRMRPRIVIVYQGPLGLPPIPDLAVSTADIRFCPMRPVPGQPVMIQARVRNNGPGDAWNVPVAFWDGPPGAGEPIGTVIVPHLASGGGSSPAEITWTSLRGLREMHVQVDPEGVIDETDEENNADFRPFLVSDPEAYVQSVESFEYGGLQSWYTDFDVPKQHMYPGPKGFIITRSVAESYHGDHAMELFLDGTADDGTLWVERALPVEPNCLVEVTVGFEFFRYAPDDMGNFPPVAAISLLDPEVERDFDVIPGLYPGGWTYHTFQKTLFTGPYDMLHIGVGYTVVWESQVTQLIDLVQTQINDMPGSALPHGAGYSPATLFLRNHPNPVTPLTTIAYRLPRDGPVRLEIFDLAGRSVATLRDGSEAAGSHRIRWDGKDARGRLVPSGVYFYRLETPDGSESRKLVVAR